MVQPVGRGALSIIDSTVGRAVEVGDALGVEQAPDHVRAHRPQAHVRGTDAVDRPRVHQPLQWNIGSVHR